MENFHFLCSITSPVKAWKGYSLNGAGILKPKTGDDVETLPSAEKN